jgi:hypothetical protein
VETVSWLRREPGRIQKNRSTTLQEIFLNVAGLDRGGMTMRVDAGDGLHGVARLSNIGHLAHFSWRWPADFVSLVKAELAITGGATGASWDYQIGATGLVDGESMGVGAGLTNTTGSMAIVLNQLDVLDVSGVFGAAQQVAGDWMVFGVSQTDAGIDAFILGLWLQYRSRLNS